MVSPVTDRAKLAGSWDKMNTTLTGTLAKVSEMTGQEIPMQKPISSDKDGNTTWFFPMPFFTDDFMPSVTVGDKWFVASTSKNQALDLIDKADGGGETRDGLWFTHELQDARKIRAGNLRADRRERGSADGSSAHGTAKEDDQELRSPSSETSTASPPTAAARQECCGRACISRRGEEDGKLLVRIWGGNAV